ncbi:MAG: DnaJ domain-containing protein [Pseudomonadales bacterium]|nr:DnaJ domain-containing protein [Pseudomonadales bacterium]
MDYKDYYQTLKVDKQATQDEVKRAYRKLARKYHPDVSKEQNAEALFKEVGEAYEVLKDPEKRAAYDQLGMNWQAGQQFEAPPNWDAGFEFSGDGGAAAFSDFFESLFGRDQATQNAQSRANPNGPFGASHTHAEDHHAKVLIDIDDAYHSTTRTITLQAPEIDSTGHLVNKQRSLRVKIPKGVKQGQKIRLAGQGSSGLGKGTAGDLYLEIEFAPHAFYRVDGKDIYLDLPVTPWEVALNRKVKMPTPTGTIDVRIPKHAKTGQKLRIKGKGIPAKQPGDIYAMLQIIVPEAKTDEQKALYEKMEQALPDNPRSAMGV